MKSTSKRTHTHAHTHTHTHTQTHTHTHRNTHTHHHDEEARGECLSKCLHTIVLMPKNKIPDICVRNAHHEIPAMQIVNESRKYQPLNFFKR